MRPAWRALFRPPTHLRPHSLGGPYCSLLNGSEGVLDESARFFMASWRSVYSGTARTSNETLPEREVKQVAGGWGNLVRIFPEREVRGFCQRGSLCCPRSDLDSRRGSEPRLPRHSAEGGLGTLDSGPPRRGTVSPTGGPAPVQPWGRIPSRSAQCVRLDPRTRSGETSMVRVSAHADTDMGSSHTWSVPSREMVWRCCAAEGSSTGTI